MNLSSIDLNLLLVLHTVLKEKTVARAAIKLNVTPPAVSNALARLRDILDDPLLVRRGRGLVATPRAAELAPQLETAVEVLQRALEERFDPAVTSRRYSLALSDADQACSGPEIAAALTRSMPHAALQMVSLDTLAASDGLATGAVDAVIGPAPMYPPKPGVYRENLYKDEAALLVNRGYRAPLRARLSAKQFNALRYVDTWLVLGERSAGHHVTEEFLRRHGLKRNFALVVPNFFTAAIVAASSDLASVMPRRLAERFASILPLRILTIPAPALRFQQQLIWHERTQRDSGAIAFRELVCTVMRRPWRAGISNTSNPR
jgi:DNA-binding transcriptional LysR family regulator